VRCLPILSFGKPLGLVDELALLPLSSHQRLLLLSTEVKKEERREEKSRVKENYSAVEANL
jgi:hypothetical protein